MLEQSQKSMSDLGLKAGLGVASFSRTGWWVATHYHVILALVTGAVLWTAGYAAGHGELFKYMTLAYGAYAIMRWFVYRHEPARRKLYTELIQFIRAQLIYLTVTVLLLITGAPGANTGLWILYVLGIQIASRHCKSWAFTLITAQSMLTIPILALFYQLPDTFRDPPYLLVATGVAQALGLGMVAFMLHYLMRNIDARDETIETHRLVNSLTSKLATASAEDQWKLVLKICIEALGAQRGSLWKKNGAEQSFYLATTWSDEGQSDTRDGSDPERLPKPITPEDDDVIGQAIRDQTPVCRELGATVTRPRYPLHLPHHFYGSEQTVYRLAAPIIDYRAPQPRPLAVLCFDFYRDSPLEKQVIAEFKTLLANLTQYIEPLLGYYQRVEEEIALQEACRKIAVGRELDEVLNALLPTLLHPVGFEFASVSLVEEEQHVIRMVAGLNIPPAWKQMTVRDLDSDDILADIVRSGQREVLYNWDPRFDHETYERFDHDSMLRVFEPIFSLEQPHGQRRVIGVLEAGYFNRGEKQDISPDQLRMLNALIEQATIAIEWSRLLERVNKKAEVLATLNTVGRAILSQRHLRHVLDEIGREAKRIMRADSVMLYQYMEEMPNQLAEPLIFGEMRVKPRYNLDLTRPNSILSQLFHTKRPVYLSEPLKEEVGLSWDVLRLEARSPKPKRFTQTQQIQSFAGIPLIVEHEAVGLLFVNFHQRHIFSDDEQQILEMFAQHAAWAIHNVTVNTRLRQAAIAAERARMSRELHDSISQHVPGIRLMAEATLKHLDVDVPKAKNSLREIIDASDSVMKELRYHVFRPEEAPTEARIEPALHAEAKMLKDRYGLQVHINLRILNSLISPLEVGLIGIAREALVNVARHARATCASLEVWDTDTDVIMKVTDDGCGFEPTAKDMATCYGLSSMRQRAEELFGSLEIQSQVNCGTSILVKLPLMGGGHADYTSYDGRG